MQVQGEQKDAERGSVCVAVAAFTGVQFLLSPKEAPTEQEQSIAASPPIAPQRRRRRNVQLELIANDLGNRWMASG